MLRILRLTRIFRMAMMGQYPQVFPMLQNTMRKSIPMEGGGWGFVTFPLVTGAGGQH